MPSSVRERYLQELARHGYESDPAQERAVALLDDLRDRLLTSPPPTSLLKGLLSRRKAREPQRGLYLWGGVGRGKTWLMDLFFQSLPIKDKQRSHFHRFMQSVHDELKKHRDRTDPLELVAEKISSKARVLCFDELFVSDIADAMLLGNLFRGLFDRGVTLVATSNVRPDDLYKDGLQRARFLPAIELLKEHMHVEHMDGGADYRLRLLERAVTWLDANSPGTDRRMSELFDAMGGDAKAKSSTLTLNHRRMTARRQADGAVWFEFKELCDGPRGQSDYIEIARCFHTVFLSHVPIMGPDQEDSARRFISLVDEFYDRNVKLIAAAAAPIQGVYQGSRLKFEFERTRSRLTEMQSQEYLARPHKP